MMNKVVLITGGARRIGAETANYLHSKGMNILITYSKSASAARALRKSLNSKREKSCEIYRVEFKSNLNYKNVANDILKIFGRIDYLINNASKFYPTKINDVSEKVWLDTIDTNIKAPLFLSKHLDLPYNLYSSQILGDFFLFTFTSLHPIAFFFIYIY